MVDKVLKKLFRELDFDGYYQWSIDHGILEVTTFHVVHSPGVPHGEGTIGGGFGSWATKADFNIADPEFLEKVTAWTKRQHLRRSS